jgi:hypothetical protein
MNLVHQSTPEGVLLTGDKGYIERNPVEKAVEALADRPT